MFQKIPCFLVKVLIIPCIGFFCVPCEAQNHAAYDTQLYRVIENGLIGYIDSSGFMKVPPQFKSGFEFQEGLAAASVDGERLGFIDYTGEFVIPPKLFRNYVFDFSQGLALCINSDAQVGYIDRTGCWTISPQFYSGHPFTEGLAAVFTKDHGGFIDRSGTVVIPLKFDEVESFSGGRALFGVHGPFDVETGISRTTYGYIDKSGAIVIPAEYDYAGYFVNGLAPVVKGENKIGYIDTTGRYVIEPRFPLACSSTLMPKTSYVFSEGLAAVSDGKRWGYIDTTGEFVIPPRFIEVRNFSEGLASVRLDSLYGAIDFSGKLVIPGRFAGLGGFSGGVAQMALPGYKDPGWVHRNGNIIWRPIQKESEATERKPLVHINYGHLSPPRKERENHSVNRSTSSSNKKNSVRTSDAKTIAYSTLNVHAVAAELDRFPLFSAFVVVEDATAFFAGFTDSAGTVRGERIQNGRYRVSITAFGYAPFDTLITLSKMETTTLTIPLSCKCESPADKVKDDIARGRLKIYLSDGMYAVYSGLRLGFELQYGIQYVSLGCAYEYPDEWYALHNIAVFEHLDREFGDGWRSKLIPSAFGRTLYIQ